MRLVLPALFLAFFISSCSGESNRADSSTETADQAETTPVEDDHYTSAAVDAYLQLKEAMVESNLDAGKTAAGSFQNELASLPESDTLVSVMQLAIDSLSVAGDLEQQRAAFRILSDNFYIYLKKSGNGRVLYRQYCPMAFQNDGAYWLSDQSEIANPYMPETMLKCGRVSEEL